MPPGTYIIKVVTLESNRNMIQVTNEDQTKVFASVLATPHAIRAGEVVPSTRYTYYTTAAGQPKALRTWFPRDTVNGQDIIYPKRRAMFVAEASPEKELPRTASHVPLYAALGLLSLGTAVGLRTFANRTA